MGDNKGRTNTITILHKLMKVSMSIAFIQSNIPSFASLVIRWKHVILEERRNFKFFPLYSDNMSGLVSRLFTSLVFVSPLQTDKCALLHAQRSRCKCFVCPVIGAYSPYRRAEKCGEIDISTIFWETYFSILLGFSIPLAIHVFFKYCI